MQKQGRYLILIAILFIVEDIVLLNLLFFGLLWFFNLSFTETYRLVLTVINLGYLLSFAIVRVNFNDVKQLHIPHLIRRNFYKLAITASILILSLFFLKISSVVSRLFILTFFSSAYFLMIIAQWITRKAVTFTIRKTISKGVILGAGLIGGKVFDELLCNVYNGVVILGFFDDDRNKNGGDVLGNIEQAKEYILKMGVTQVFCTLPLSAGEKIVDFIKFCESHVINFHIVPSIGYYYTGSQPPIVENIGKMPVFILRNIPLSYMHNAVMKRGVDILLSSIAITLLFPVLFPVLAVLIKMSSPGPIFFKQTRTGKRGKEFCCYKFRTMRCSADAHTKQATADDNRKTKIGDFLRKTSLDELPQFYNVLIGNMALVGPRPHMLLHTYEYSPKVDKYMVRHFVKPGITGLAQVNGYRGETKEIELMEKRIRADIHYVENWTLQMDFKIMAQTVLMIVKGDEKAY
ncbi:MAG: undecaprenyl-phosphate glucose phosphotransferase [Bacteroidales bacterium]|jgi:putative colanic acid biosynthesis UDP-glucose lipid carrier transferase|nr:undecaprenyl-phosphate glucose phosphotransferase [Bacteroidales bacterium]